MQTLQVHEHMFTPNENWDPICRDYVNQQGVQPFGRKAP